MPPCPACDAPLYGWAQVEPPGGGSPILLQRCEECGLAIVAGTSAGEAIGELFGAAHGAREVRAPNRRSLQAALGGRRWAALDPERRRVYPTPEALQLLAARAGLEIEALRFPASRQALRWMWQTVVNSFTFRPNLATHSLAGRARPRGPWEGLAFAFDWIVTILATPLVLLISVPLELAGAAASRGGELVAVVRPRPTAPAATRA